MALKACTWQPTPMKSSRRTSRWPLRSSSNGLKFGDNIGFTPPEASTSSTVRANMGLGSKGRSGEAEPTQSTASTRPARNISQAMLVMTPVHARFAGRSSAGTRKGKIASATPK
mmetsp:Transcript_118778/g.288358  ORF Transcript_118778/g.288358 Transcript_118778/m.288358 type:complete len:114 (-) Transcript_118778:173-514(-)